MVALGAPLGRAFVDVSGRPFVDGSYDGLVAIPPRPTASSAPSSSPPGRSPTWPPTPVTRTARINAAGKTWRRRARHTRHLEAARESPRPWTDAPEADRAPIRAGVSALMASDWFVEAAVNARRDAAVSAALAGCLAAAEHITTDAIAQAFAAAGPHKGTDRRGVRVLVRVGSSGWTNAVSDLSSVWINLGRPPDRVVGWRPRLHRRLTGFPKGACLSSLAESGSAPDPANCWRRPPRESCRASVPHEGDARRLSKRLANDGHEALRQPRLAPLDGRLCSGRPSLGQRGGRRARLPQHEFGGDPHQVGLSEHWGRRGALRSCVDGRPRSFLQWQLPPGQLSSSARAWTARSGRLMVARTLRAAWSCSEVPAES